MADIVMTARRTIRPWHILAGLGVLAIVSSILFMTVGARGNWSFILSFRGTKLAALVLVAYSIAVSTVLFQTVTHNRILTPSIMGFDAMYILIQTCLVFFLGGLGTAMLNTHFQFFMELAAMLVFSTILFRWLFSGASHSLHLLVLVGIVIGTFFRSFANFMQRIIDPNEFAFLQDRFFASFNSVNADLLAVSFVLVVLASVVMWRISHTFDVLSLGRENAINLGVEHKKIVTIILMLVAVFVSVSTALVGPVTFFGLLVANLAYLMMGTSKHRYVLPAAMLIAIVALVGGQMILERVFNFNSALSIIIEFLGGLVFIILILRGAAR